VEKYGTEREATDDIIRRICAACWITKVTHVRARTHTQRKCKAYCLCTATMVKRTHLTVTFIYTLPGSLQFRPNYIPEAAKSTQRPHGVTVLRERIQGTRWKLGDISWISVETHTQLVKRWPPRTRTSLIASATRKLYASPQHIVQTMQQATTSVESRPSETSEETSYTVQ
jgi:hypothetical protein